MSFQSAWNAAVKRPLDPELLGQLAKAAIAEGEEDRALPLIEKCLEQSPTARLWQWKGLVERANDNLEMALTAFAEAARLDPLDASIAHGRARAAMEAGVDAREYYERARALAPQNGQVLIGQAAALASAGEGPAGAALLQAGVSGSPIWLEGHVQLAQLMATLGQRENATASIEEALRKLPSSRPLWETFLNLQLRRGEYGSLLTIVERAEAAGVSSPEFAIYRGIHAAEFSEEDEPAALFSAAPASTDAALGRWRIRHLLRAGAANKALSLIDRELRRDQSGELWAYASTAWRMAGDERWRWLEGDSRLVSVADITHLLPPIDQLATTLRALHQAKGEYLDQSVRGGTQTDGPLFSRVDPVIRELRRAVSAAVKDHVAQLPPVDANHPMLRHRRDRKLRFSGSWSVRLRSGGHHSNHVHPQGWISSALYIGLPAKQTGEAKDAGWLTLGAPDEKLGVDLPAWRKVEPKIGQLVLFPSCMWHGTIPFGQGERLTVAFDVAPPR